MFHTQPEAEFPFLSAINPRGEKTWAWIEFALYIPLYLVSGRVVDEDGDFGSDFLFGRLDDVLTLVNASSGRLTDIEVALLSPGHLNGSSSYKLGRLKEVWRHPSKGSHRFVLEDGKEFRYHYEDSNDDDEMELALSL